MEGTIKSDICKTNEVHESIIEQTEVETELSKDEHISFNEETEIKEEKTKYKPWQGFLFCFVCILVVIGSIYGCTKK